MGSACPRDAAVDLALPFDVCCLESVPVGIRGQGDVHFGDVDLHSQRGKARDVGSDRSDVGVEVEQVHLQADTVDGHTAPLEVPHHGVNRVGFGIQGFAFGVVLEEQRSGIGGVRPLEDLFHIRGSFPGETYARAVVPDRVFEVAMLFEGFVDDVPGKDPSTISA